METVLYAAKMFILLSDRLYGRFLVSMAVRGESSLLKAPAAKSALSGESKCAVIFMACLFLSWDFVQIASFAIGFVLCFLVCLEFKKIS